jgi:hypothetical protein
VSDAEKQRALMKIDLMMKDWCASNQAVVIGKELGAPQPADLVRRSLALHLI